MLPPEFEFCQIRGSLGMWCVHRKGTTRFTLCQEPIYYLPGPGWQPRDPSNVHRECLLKLAELPRPRPKAVPVGRCPMCNGDAEMVGDRIGPHGRWVPGVNGVLAPTSEPCVGVNLRPRKVGRRR